MKKLTLMCAFAVIGISAMAQTKKEVVADYSETVTVQSGNAVVRLNQADIQIIKKKLSPYSNVYKDVVKIKAGDVVKNCAFADVLIELSKTIKRS